MKKTKIERKNVPEFTPLEPKFIERVENINQSISEESLKLVKDLTRYYFSGSFFDYIYEINFSKDSVLQQIDSYSFCMPMESVNNRSIIPIRNLFSHIYSITFPPSLQIINSYALGKCDYLNQISFLKNDDGENFLEVICKKAFTDTKLESILIPENICHIGSKCFPRTLKTIEFENGAPKLNKIDDYAFYNTQIEKISLPLHTVPFRHSNNVFLNCRKLKTIVFDQYINKEEEPDENIINDDDDYNRSYLLSQTKIENLEIYVSCLKKFHFFNTPKLNSITVPKGKYAKYVKQKGCLYTKDKKKLIVAERNIKSATINSKCQSIENYAFNVKSLEKVTFENESELEEISFFAFSESQIKKLSIPATVNSILEGAFYNCNKLDSINLPKSIQKLEYVTFSYTNLKEVKIPKSVKTINYGCFYKCSKLSTVSFEENSELEEIENYAFAETSITSITIPKSVKKIDDFCFINCQKLKTITFEDDSVLSYLGKECFRATKIEEFHLPKSIEYCHFSHTKAKVVSIPSQSLLEKVSHFQSTQITEITVPSTVKKIGKYAFFECSNLTTVKMVDVANSKLEKIGKGAFIDCKNLKEFEIPKSVYYFGLDSFKNCSHLKLKINVCNNYSISVKEFAFYNSGIISFVAECPDFSAYDSSFKDCKNLKKIEIKNCQNDFYFGPSLFMNCTSLTDVKIPQEIRYSQISENCFYNSSIIEFNFPIALTKVPKCCFKNCKNLTHVSFRDECAITIFEDEAFYESGIKSIVFPPRTEEICESCFENCKGLKEVTLSKSITKILDKAFASTSIEEIDFQSYYLTFGLACFKDCTKLKKVTFSENTNVKLIPESLFESCAIETIKMFNNLKIDQYAFKNCKQLSSISLYCAESYIGAFEGCDKLNDIRFQDSNYARLNAYLDGSYRYCPFKISIKQSTKNKKAINALLNNTKPPFQYAWFFDWRNSLLLNKNINYFEFELIHFCEYCDKSDFNESKKLHHRTVTSKNGGYFLDNGKKIFFCDFSLDSLIIPKETEIIKSYAFKYTNLKKIDFEKGSKLKEIKKFAFENLQIEEISIPDTVTSIGNSAFRDCHQLKIVNINKESQLTLIGESAFEKTAIESILFPSNLKQIESLAFYDCYKLTKVENYSNEITFGFQSFFNSSIETINFPSKSVFEESSFKNCLKLKQLTFLNSPVKLCFGIESFAFSGLEELKLECEVEIQENAFMNCLSLKQIALKGKKIECFASSFVNCYNLESCVMNVKSLTYKANDVLDDFYDSSIEKVSLTLKCPLESEDNKMVTQKIFLNHKCYVVDNVLEYSNLIDNVSLYEKNPPGKKVQIKKNEVLRVPSNVKKMNMTTMSHIKKIQWASNCIVEDLGREGLFSYYNLIEISIPKMVTKIEPHLFEHCHFLQVVTFDEDSRLEEIGDYGFSNTRIESIKLPKTVKKIGDFAFFNDFHLTEISFEGKVIGEKAFSLTALKSFTLSNNTEFIGDGAFQDCHYLTEFKIDIENSNLSEIGEFAFSSTMISEFTIPSLIKTINDYLFEGCTLLEKVIFSNDSNLESINCNPFKGCNSLKLIQVPEKIFNLVKDKFKSIQNDEHHLYYTFEGDELEPGNVSEDEIDHLCYIKTKIDEEIINPECFVKNDCYVVHNELKYVHLIDNSLLYQKQENNDVKENEVLHVPSGVNKLNFTYMSHIKLIEWPQKCTVNDLGNEGFFSYYNLIEITIPKLVKVIPNCLFNHCHYLRKVKFEKGSKLTEIGNFAFAYTSIDQINLPKTVHTIGDSSFYNCLNLKEINFEGKMIGEEAFAYSGLTNFTLSNRTKSIGSSAFQYCKSLKTFNIDVENSNLTEIGSSAFSESSIEFFNFPQKVKIIKSGTFEGCKFLKDVNFTNKSSLSIIEDYSFAGDLNLETINIPKSITKLVSTAFINTPSLQYIMNRPNQSFKVMKNLAVYGKDGTLYFVPRNMEKYRVMKNCFIIHSGAFCGPCIEKVTFSDNSTVEFEKCAFAHSTALKRIQMPNSLRLIGDEAFIDCQSLEKVEFEPVTKLKEIPNFCFAFSGLKIIKLPISIEVIKNSSFYFCQNLKSVNLADTNVKYIGDNAFLDTNLSEVKLPKSCRFVGSHSFAGIKLIRLADLTKLARIKDTVQLPIVSFVRKLTKSNKKLSNAICKFVKEQQQQLQQQQQQQQQQTEQPEQNNEDQEENNNESQDDDQHQQQQNQSKNENNNGDGIENDGVDIVNGGKKLPPISLNMISKKNPVIIKPGVNSSRPTSARISSPTKSGRQNILPVLPPVDDQQNKSPRRINKDKKPSNLNDNVQTIKFDYQEAKDEDDNNNNNSICYIHELAFDKTTVKLFNFELEEFIWYHFFDNCARIEQYTVNEIIHLYLHKLVKEKPKPNSLTGQFFKVKKLGSQDDFTIPLALKPFSSHHRILNPFNFVDFTKLLTVTLTEDIEIEEIPKFVFASSALKEITIPSSVNSIKEYAFYSCRSLSKVIIPNNSELTEIMENAFFGCRKLASIKLPKLIKSISRKCFASSGLRSIKIPKATKIVNEMAFYSCSKLSKITFNKRINELGKFAFANNPLIESIDIPDSLKIIKEYCFSNCYNLKQVNTTENTKLVEIHNGSFENTLIESLGVNCKATKLFRPTRVPNLNKITFHQGEPKKFIQTEDGVIYEKKDKIKIYDNDDDNGVEKNGYFDNDMIPENEVINWANENVKSNKVDSYLELLFVPKKLECLKIHPNCRYYNRSILDDMVNLEMIEYSEGATNYVMNFPYYNHLFTGQRNKLKKIKIMGNYSFIEKNSFSYFNSLETVEFGEKTSIICVPEFAFLSCQKLTKISIPSSCFSIYNSAFKDCLNLEIVEFKKDGRLRYIGVESFKNCTSLKSIVLPSSIETICESSFMNCKSLEKVEFNGFEQSKLKTIEKNAFRNCTSLQSFKLPPNSENLGPACFMDCINLQEFEYKGSKLAVIKGRTFKNCEKLIKFSLKIIPEIEKFINDEEEEDEIVVNLADLDIMDEAFMNCISLKEVDFEDASQNIETIKFTKEKVPIPKYDTHFYKKTQKIGKRAFYNCKSLTKATFFIRNLIYFDENTFENCSSLKSIEINSYYWKEVMTNNLKRNTFLGTNDQLEVKLFNKGQFVDISFKVDNKPQKLLEKRHFKQHLSSLNKNLIWPETENKGEFEKRMIISENIFFYSVEKRDFENPNKVSQNNSEKVNDVNVSQNIEKVDDLNEVNNLNEKIEKSSEKVNVTNSSEKVEYPIDKIIRKRHFQQYLSSLNRSFIAWFIPDKMSNTKQSKKKSNEEDENTKYHHKKLPLYGECKETDPGNPGPDSYNVEDSYNYLYRKPKIFMHIRSNYNSYPFY